MTSDKTSKPRTARRTESTKPEPKPSAANVVRNMGRLHASAEFSPGKFISQVIENRGRSG